MRDMKCGRPGCKEREDRIDGYCSCYCRDVHEATVEADCLRRGRDVLLALVYTIGFAATSALTGETDRWVDAAWLKTAIDKVLLECEEKQ